MISCSDISNNPLCLIAGSISIGYWDVALGVLILSSGFIALALVMRGFFILRSLILGRVSRFNERREYSRYLKKLNHELYHGKNPYMAKEDISSPKPVGRNPNMKVAVLDSSSAAQRAFNSRSRAVRGDYSSNGQNSSYEKRRKNKYRRVRDFRASILSNVQREIRDSSTEEVASRSSRIDENGHRGHVYKSKDGHQVYVSDSGFTKLITRYKNDNYVPRKDRIPSGRSKRKHRY